MPPRDRLLIVLVAALVAAGPAVGQDKPKRRGLPPRPTVSDAASAAPAPTTATSSAPPPLGGLGGLGASSRPTGLVGLRPVGDPAPACRAQCSKDRYVCHAAGDATDCDSRWVPCLQACSPH